MPKAKLYKKCRQCHREYRAWSSASNLNRWCSMECAIAWQSERTQKQRLKASRAKTREQRAKHKGIGHWQNETQKIVNEFVRERDYFRPCMTHGQDCEHHLTGPWDAGHFKAVGMGGGSPLRFNCWNIHKQCRDTNRGSHKYAKYGRTPDQMNEANLRKRIGDARVDWLNGPHEQPQYTIDDLARIRRIFRKRTRLYERLRREGKRRGQLRDAQ